MKYNTVLVIGNGFDINLGLETSYKNFLEKCDKFNGQADVGSMYLFKHLKQQHQLNNWIDLELELKNYSFSSDIPPKSSFIYLQECIYDYLSKFQINQSHIKNMKDTQSFSLLKQVVGLKNFIILNFNYTNSVIEILKYLGINETDIKKRHIPVHGTILDNNIVVGVDEDFLGFEKLPFLIKTNNVRYVHHDISEIMNEARNVIFFGHSIGKTDHSHFDRFFLKNSELLGNNQKQKRSLTVFYHGEDDWYNKTVQLANLTNRKLTAIRNNLRFEKIDTEGKNAIPKIKELLLFEDEGILPSLLH